MEDSWCLSVYRIHSSGSSENKINMETTCQDINPRSFMTVQFLMLRNINPETYRET